MTVTVTLRERGSNAFLELRSLFIVSIDASRTKSLTKERGTTLQSRNYRNGQTRRRVILGADP